MGVSFVLGRAGAGKTHYCISRIREELARDSEPLRAESTRSEASPRLLFIVPEQASFEMERALAGAVPGGGFWRAQVLSFSRLARRLFAEAGPGTLDRAVPRQVVLRLLLSRDSVKSALFGKAGKTAGFCAKLDGLIEELLRENISPDDLFRNASRLPEGAGRKVESIAGIYSDYLGWLGEQRLDPAMHLALLRERIVGLDWLAQASIWVDGFAGFSGQELATLTSLAASARNVVITLLVDPDSRVVGDPTTPVDPLSPFGTTEKTYQQITQELRAARVAIAEPIRLRPTLPPRFSAQPMLAELEAGFGSLEVDFPASQADGSARSKGGASRERAAPQVSRTAGKAETVQDAQNAVWDDAVRIFECPTHRDELRLAAHRIRESVLTSGGKLRYRDFAVVVRDLPPFADMAAEVFSEYGVPHFIDRRRSMRAHALCRLVRSVLDTVRTRFSTAATLRVIRTGLHPLERGVAEQLEHTIELFSVRGVGVWSRIQPWSFDDAYWEEEEARRRHEITREVDSGRRLIFAALEPLLNLGLHGGRAGAIREESAASATAGGVREPPHASMDDSSSAKAGSADQRGNLLFDFGSPAAEAGPRKPQAEIGVVRDLVGPTAASVERGLPAGSTWAKALYATLEKLEVRRRMETWIERAQAEGDWETAELHRLAWKSLVDALNDLHACLNAVPLSIRDLTDVLLAGLDDVTLGVAPPALDHVLIGGIERTRHPDVRHVWVVGFNDGVFPAAPAEDELLTTAERRALSTSGFPAPATHRDEALGEHMLAYIAFTRPSETLSISFARVDAEGRPLEPSPLIELVHAALPQVRLSKMPRDLPPVCLTELARGFLETRQADALSDLHTRYAALVRHISSPSNPQAAELQRLLRGVTYRNECRPASLMAARAADSRVWRGSVSQIGTYIQCPFKFFAEYRLGLKEPAAPPTAPRMLGSVAHGVLAEVMRRAAACGKAFRGLTQEDWLGYLEDVLANMDRGRPADLAERMPRQAFLAGMLKRFLQDIVIAHAARYRRGGFEPYRMEWSFGRAEQGALPPLQISVKGAVIELRGKIDRVDVCRSKRGEAFLVYDYKPWVQPPNIRFLTENRLQLFTYLLALRRGLPKGGKVAGALIAPLSVDSRAFDAAPNGGSDVEQIMEAYKPRGVFDQGFVEVLDKAMGESSPVAMIRLKKDGEFAAVGNDAKPAEELERIIDLAEQTLTAAAGGIVEGRIEIAPLLENRTLACTWCPFRPVCRYDPIYNKARLADRDLPQLAGPEGEA